MRIIIFHSGTRCAFITCLNKVHNTRTSSRAAIHGMPRAISVRAVPPSAEARQVGCGGQPLHALAPAPRACRRRRRARAPAMCANQVSAPVYRLSWAGSAGVGLILPDAATAAMLSGARKRKLLDLSLPGGRASLSKLLCIRRTQIHFSPFPRADFHVRRLPLVVYVRWFFSASITARSRRGVPGRVLQPSMPPPCILNAQKTFELTFSHHDSQLPDGAVIAGC